MRSIKKAANLRGARNDTDTVESILRCFQVKTRRNYDALAAAFQSETDQVQAEEQVEVEKRILALDRTFIHDRCSQVVFRIRDTEGHSVEDFDLLLTAGDDSDPNHLPENFFRDRQRSQNELNTITYFINYDLMVGCAEIPGVRDKSDGIKSLGFMLHPRPEEGFVHYQKCRISASANLFRAVVKPNQTTLVDIILNRVVHSETFRLDRTLKQGSFKDVKPGDEIVN